MPSKMAYPMKSRSVAISLRRASGVIGPARVARPCARPGDAEEIRDLGILMVARVGDYPKKPAFASLSKLVSRWGSTPASPTHMAPSAPSELIASSSTLDVSTPVFGPR